MNSKLCYKRSYTHKHDTIRDAKLNGLAMKWVQVILKHDLLLQVNLLLNILIYFTTKSIIEVYLMSLKVIQTGFL